ncbi:PREDICTED: aquaporin-like [Drosophila arizonae]|uniref:Aquaporin-like n=1 Tax=Drosophila arizonae TaxID=7263 RepID=A0ABM1PL61_DROAR|nr:PREDICTED: aquaporin-like [Drosophila arizonae]
MGNFAFDKELAKRLLAEFTGTALVLTLGCCYAKSGGGYDTHSTQSSFAWGLAYLTAIHIFAMLSGAHLNPAVSGTATIVGIMEWQLMLWYMLAQLLGAMAGIALTYAVLQTSKSLCLSGMDDKVNVLSIELLATFFLLLAYCAAWDTRSEGAYETLSLRIGFIFTGLSFATYPTTGCHLNFFRTFAAAAVNGSWGIIWPYLVAHAAAAAAAGCIWRFLFAEEAPEPMA